MDKEEYQERCDSVEDTAYAEKGHPQTFGNELLLQNIDAFGRSIADLHSVSYTHLTLPTIYSL